MVDKITSPITPLGEIDKINEVIDQVNTNTTGIAGKQATLVSGTNIKTINNNSILGSGNITIQSTPSIDNKSITTNTSSELQTVGVIDQNNTSNAIKTWTGTKAQYKALVDGGTVDSGTLYNTIDDTDVTLSLLELLYPIGSIYIGTMNACPLAVLGVGTWQLVGVDKVLQGAGTRGSVKASLTETLPNISGYFCNWEGENKCDIGEVAGTTTGCFRNEFGSCTKYISAPTKTASNGTGKLTFDASLSNPIYQDNAHVQQNAYLVNIWERIS